jgi:predicted HD phosphohydrolase
MTEHPITPPPELVEQWADEFYSAPIAQGDALLDIATRAAQWGADQELDACCEWLHAWTQNKHPGGIENLRAARRPKPQSLKEQALEIVRGTPVNSAGLYSYEHVEIIRRALEQLDD